MADPVITAAIERNLRLGAALNVEGTPAYRIEDQFVPGAIDVEGLSKIVSREPAKMAGPITH